MNGDPGMEKTIDMTLSDEYGAFLIELLRKVKTKIDDTGNIDSKHLEILKLIEGYFSRYRK